MRFPPDSHQSLLTLTALGPLSPFSSSKETFAPSLSDRYPSPVIPEKWTKRSRPPPSGVMNPKPFSSENHLTVPVLTDTPLHCSARHRAVHISTGPVRPVPTGQTLYIDIAPAQPELVKRGR